MSYTGGLSITQEMKAILDRPGFLSEAQGGQALREMYQKGSLDLDFRLLSPFAQAILFGSLSEVKRIFALLKPNLSGAETPWRLGYATLAVWGMQKIVGPPGSQDYFGILEFLLSQGLFLDVPDLAGYTALHHACMARKQLEDVVRYLLKNGADPNHRHRYGGVYCDFHKIFSAMQQNHTAVVDALMEYGADIDTKDADDYSARDLFVTCGPQVAATMTKWIRKRAGEEEAPREVKRCDQCKKPWREGAPLKNCSRCRVASCSTECQKKAWPNHKTSCKPFSKETTVTLKPTYKQGSLMPSAEWTWSKLGCRTDTPEEKAAAATPKNLDRRRGQAKNIVIKVQVPFTGTYPVERSTGDLMVYTKKRDFSCSIRRQDCPEAYEEISEVIRTKSARGAKAYFTAELQSKDKLVVKISDVLAEQPW
ncbi:hypothetical protein HMN09_01201100 [Mycena chlorophos]|uniref:MYND-type domain-containing protein n=1 Tax=Mycena chlorophos TaxID=658473 RepID=A0A8H6VYX6_MYCCL|nr:hypothetical protein HMN09_01201100 [Mycena chlorophos]